MKSRFYIVAIMMIFALVLPGCKKKETPIVEPEQSITAAEPAATPEPTLKAEPTPNMEEILEKIKTMTDVNIPPAANDVKK